MPKTTKKRTTVSTSINHNKLAPSPTSQSQATKQTNTSNGQQNQLDLSKLGAPASCMSEMNRYYALANAKSKVVIIQVNKDGFDILTTAAFKDMFANKYVIEGKKSIPVGDFWFKHADRREYLGGIAFDPSQAAIYGKFNLWKGLAVEPDSNKSCELFLDHLESVICSSNRECYEYMLDWCALLVQKPHVIPGVAICLLSEQGTGKGLLATYLGKLLGNHYKAITNKSHMLGQFTGPLENAVLVLADELHWDGSSSDSGMLKSLLTESTRMMEKKYLDPIPVKNCVHLIIASNEDWAIPAEIGDRRFFVLGVSPAQIGNTHYFDSLINEMNNSGPQGLLAFLQARDVSSFVPMKFPMTAARVTQQLHSLGPIEGWLYSIADLGQISANPQSDEPPWRAKIKKQCLFDEYLNYISQQKSTGTPAHIGTFTSKLIKFGFSTCKMPTEMPGMRTPGYNVPTVISLRERFEDHFGHPVIWDSPP